MRTNNLYVPTLSAGRNKSRHFADKAILSIIICLLIVVGFVLSSDQFLHWYVIPVTLCGIVIGLDAIDWLTGRLDIFDPIGILGLLGFHFFFLAPLLHVAWNHWMGYVVPPPDWRPWLGYMALLNLVGLLFYRVGRHFGGHRHFTKLSGRKIWRLNKKHFGLTLGIMLSITATMQIIIFAQQGGIAGYIDYVTSGTKTDASIVFQGMGWIFMISESFPILSMIGFVIYAKGRSLSNKWYLFLFLFFILQFVFGGLRGSRSNTIWALFWALGIIHFWVQPISRSFLYAGIVLMVIFMYLYGFYKDVGINAVNTIVAGNSISVLEQQTGRSLPGLILGDLGRSDVQAYLLYRITDPDNSYDYGWGRSFVGALSLLIPRSVWPDRPPTIEKEGTEAQYGIGTYVPSAGNDRWVSSLVYGLAGEAMLNFGPFAIPPAFIVLGLAVGWTQRKLHQWDSSDLRRIFLPFLVNLCFIILVGDSDNILWFCIKSGFMPFLLIISNLNVTVGSRTPQGKLSS